MPEILYTESILNEGLLECTKPDPVVVIIRLEESGSGMAVTPSSKTLSNNY